jgi:flagellar biosynthesis protein FlhF
MRILKFEGATMREAIAKAKAELGDQAVIISSRQVRRGLLGTAIEISAAIDDDSEDRAADMSSPAFTKHVGPRPAPRPEPAPDLEKLIAPLKSELRSLRAIVRSSANEAAGIGKLESELVALRQLVEKLAQPSAPARTAEPARAASIAEAVAAAATKRRAKETELPLIAGSSARIVMLVGPTGAGKTTTLAKLAAHAALVEGRRVRVITLDTFRVGGVEQMRTYTDLIGVPQTVLEHPADLAEAVDTPDDLILIDTAGRSPLDTGPLHELASAIAPLAEIEVHLVVPAATSPEGIDALLRRYAALSPARLLFTKLDEQDATPELLLAPRRTRLPITWVTTGQAVPEDLEQPTAHRLGELAARGVAGPSTPTHTRAA